MKIGENTNLNSPGNKPSKPSHIKDESHVNLDTLLSELRREGFWGTLEVSFVNGNPYKVKKTSTISLTEKGIDELKGKG